MYRDAAQSAEHLYCSCCGTQLGTRCERCGCKVSEGQLLLPLRK